LRTRKGAAISIETGLTDEALREQGQACMLAERWQEAADALAAVRVPDDDIAMRVRLCRNLISLQSHRPGVYRAVVDAEPGDRYRLVASRTGLTTIVAKAGEREIKLSPDNDPLGAVEAVMRGIDADWRAGRPLGMASIGEGYFLKHIAAHPPELILGREQPIVLMEPDPRLVLACLTIHDYTGPKGPIEQKRIRWYVGDNWLSEMRDDYHNSLMLMHPAVTIRLGLNSRAIDDAAKALLIEIGQWDRNFSQKLELHTRTLTRERLVELLGSGQAPPSPGIPGEGRGEGSPLNYEIANSDGNPHPNPLPRVRGRGGNAEGAFHPPRVLIVTTRFSTVLQYSARDTEQAFRQIGWDTRLLIEPSPAHGMNRIAIRSVMADYKPELIFIIDHHRVEYGDLYPAEIPFVCWVQDNLPNLTNAKAGQSLGLRDFALIPSVQRYINQYQYPERQCLEFRKLTKVPAIPDSWESDGDDLVYVSNWSQTREQLMKETIAAVAPISGEAVATQCVNKVAEVYEQGGWLDSFGAVRRHIGLVVNSEASNKFLVTLFERLNVGLFRQQALSWAAQIAEEKGLSLAIYGNGWANNPQFAKYARGVAKYGGELEEITRKAKINLMLEPYVAIAHQRLLDGLAAGGFFAVRGNMTTALLNELIDLLARKEMHEVRNIAQAREILKGTNLERFNSLIQLSADQDATPGQFDVVRSVRELQEAGFFLERGPMLQRLDDVLFTTREEMASVIEKSLANASLRKEIMQVQRQQIVQQFSYEAGIARMVAWLRQTIAAEPATSLRTAV
jgi:hypothetical protein